VILPRWTAFRAWFGRDTGTTDVDGVTTWPVDSLRANGFDTGITFTTPVTTFPIVFTCNGGAADVGTDAFDWYMSARSDLDDHRILQLNYVAGYSGSASCTYDEDLIGRLFPGVPILGSNFVSQDALTKLFRHVTIYVQRRSDKAIQWLKPIDVMFPGTQ
jgi:hypothetical protein